MSDIEFCIYVELALGDYTDQHVCWLDSGWRTREHKPSHMRKFHLKFTHYYIAFLFLHTDPLRCATTWLYHRVAQISTRWPRWTPPNAQDPCSPIFDNILKDGQDPWSPTAQDSCSSPLRKIHVLSVRNIIPPNYGKSIARSIILLY